MFLLIDMSEFDKIHLALFDETSRIDKVFESRNRELLFCIDQIANSSEPTFDLSSSRRIANSLKSTDNNEIDGIMVVVGSGSFTSERIGCVVANSFVYVRQIPVLAISLEDVGRVQEIISLLLEQPNGQFISATYSGEPNIGKSTK